MRVAPDDWSDVAAWNTYHAAPGRSVEFYFSSRLRFVPSLRERRFTRVWLPGSGTSLVPRAYAELGFDVLSSDFSEVAVDWQGEAARSPLPPKAQSLLAEHLDSSPPALMRVELHDFRQPLSSPPFDVILNVRAFQGLALGDMHAAARVHSAALRSSGWAIFETLNVPWKRRDDIEDALSAAGFVIPFLETERWYRAALPPIPFSKSLGQLLDATEKADFRALSTEYLARREAEAKATESLLSSPYVKVAHVVYSTG